MLVLQHPTIILNYTIDGQSGSILKHKSDHPTSKDEDDTKKR